MTGDGVAIQADGKIVVVGNGGPDASGEVDFALARYNPIGSLDPSFSGDGKQTTDFGGNDFASAVALQANGKIVAVGTGRDGVFALARYNPNGSLDPSFSGDGKQTTDFGATVRGQRGGASRRTARSSRSAMPRTATSPSPATTPTARSTRASPATASRRPASAPRLRDGANGVAIRARRQDRRGRAPPAISDFALARYDPDGSLDPNFSGDGKQTTSFGGLEAANGVALQADGKIVAGGSRRPGRPWRLRARPLQARTGRSTRASPATASRRPVSAGR